MIMALCIYLILLLKYLLPSTFTKSYVMCALLWLCRPLAGFLNFCPNQTLNQNFGQELAVVKQRMFQILVSIQTINVLFRLVLFTHIIAYPLHT